MCKLSAKLRKCKRTFRVFVPGKPLQPSLMFAGKAGAYPRVEYLKDASLG
jgi:hypothetical protein